jgi:serine/threonine protein kinase
VAFASEHKYRIEERIGRGGTCEVFAAVSHSEYGIERRVAIKRPTLESDPSKFLEEARLASQLDHPSVVEVLDFGMWDGSPFQVMELVDGVDLAEALRSSPDGRVPVDVALYVAYEVASALDYVHNAKDVDGVAMRVVHRDVNPSNVLVSRTGHVKVTDFGIARSFSRRRDTMIGTVKGTLGYMAPEQHRMEEVDGRADIFALGCVLHEMVTGTNPLELESARDDLVAGRCFDLSDVPAAVQTILQAALQPDVSKRCASAAELADACWNALHERTDGDPRRRTAEWIRSIEGSGAPRETMSLDVIFEHRTGTTRHFTAVARVDEFRSLADDVQPTVEADSSKEDTRIVHGLHDDSPTLPEPSVEERTPGGWVPVAVVLVGLAVLVGTIAVIVAGP